jgi:hypothetical protein
MVLIHLKTSRLREIKIPHGRYRLLESEKKNELFLFLRVNQRIGKKILVLLITIRMIIIRPERLENQERNEGIQLNMTITCQQDVL